MGWITTELVLVSLAAMLSPTTLTFSVLTLVLGDRPLRTGIFFFLGAAGATLAIGVIAAFVIGDAAAAPHPNNPKTWVADPRRRARRSLIAGFASACCGSRPTPRRRRRPSRRWARSLRRRRSRSSAPAPRWRTRAPSSRSRSRRSPSSIRARREYVFDWLFFTLVVAAAAARRDRPARSSRATGRSASSGACGAGSSGTRSRSRPCSSSCSRPRCSGTESPG